MAEQYSRSVLRVVTAQLSQAVGFDAIHSSSLDVLTNVVERYLEVLGKTVHAFSEKCGQTQAHVNDVEFAFRRLHVSIPDVVEYLQQMEPVAFPHKVGKFPAPKKSNLQFPSGNRPEDFERDEHIPLYMPSMIMSESEKKGSEEEVNEGDIHRKNTASFVIAGKHTHGSSSDEDDYSANDMSPEEYMSDDSLAHNPIKSRHLTKPEDIPTVQGTAPSSMMSVPTSSELDELRGSMSPTRRMSFESQMTDDRSDKNSKTKLQDRYVPERKYSQTGDDVPWIKSDNRRTSMDKRRTSTDHSHPSESRMRRESWASHSSTHQAEDPKWLSEQSSDKYDTNWLQDDNTSSISLTKPSTPDGSFDSPPRAKQSWYDDKPGISTSGSSKSSKSSSKSKHGGKSGPFSKHTPKSYLQRKSSFYKQKQKDSPSNKKTDLSDEPIKAKIEKAHKLLHSPLVPPYKPASPKSSKKKLSSRPLSDSPVRSSIERADSLLKYPPVEDLEIPSSRREEEALNIGTKDDKRSNFSTSKSMYDAIDTVINRASEEVKREDEKARKEAEEAELMKFSHLVAESSSSDSELDVSHKVEQMLQLEERGLRPPTPSASPPYYPSSSASPAIASEDYSVVIDEEEVADDSPVIPQPPKVFHDNSGFVMPPEKLEKSSKKEKHKKDKSRKSSSEVESHKSSHKSHTSSKHKKDKHGSKHSTTSSFVTTETISEKSMKMKVKLKPSYIVNEPRLFDVAEDRDRIRTTDIKHAQKPSKEEKHKSKEGKHSKPKEHKEHKKHSSSRQSENPVKSVEKDMSIEKIILKKSKSGDAKVVKPKAKEKEHVRTPSPPSPVMPSRSNLPLPKLSAAVPVMNVTALPKEKEKKKSKKEKKKKKERDRERNHDKDRGREKSHDKSRSEQKNPTQEKEKIREKEDKTLGRSLSQDMDVSSPLVPKLTLKMGTDEKKFVIKQTPGGGKSGSKKRSHSYVDSTVEESNNSVFSEGSPTSVERKVVTQTISAGPVGVYEDEDGNKVGLSD